MGSRALILVPPFLKYTAGPLLGPALLKSAASKSGHLCSVLDLNAKYLSPRTEKRISHGRFIGDHDKPSPSLSQIEDEFYQKTIQNLEHSTVKEAKMGFLTHLQVQTAASQMIQSSFGSWVKRELHEWVMKEKHIPQLVGISLLHSGQVIPSTAISMIARQHWPESIIVWGGSHMSGLGKRTITADLSERKYAADIFVTGHAERTFIHILDDIAKSKYDCNFLGHTRFPIVLDGNRGGMVLSPFFDDLHIYDQPLTLPVQSALGCSYGKCAYCTYPAIENTPVKLGLDKTIIRTLEVAKKWGASISVKDSLATPLRMKEIGECIKNEVKWSATTKLSKNLNEKSLALLQNNGLRTLEVGLESLLKETQIKIKKKQSQALFETFLRNTSQVPNLTLVINYMIGFPWEDESLALEKLEEVRVLLKDTIGTNRSMIELNTFELERLAPMAKYPELYGISNIRSWPWASVLEYDKKVA